MPVQESESGDLEAEGNEDGCGAEWEEDKTVDNRPETNGNDTRPLTPLTNLGANIAWRPGR